MAQDRTCAVDEESRLYVCTIFKRASPGGPQVEVDVDGSGPLPIVWSRRLSDGLPGASFSCFREETDGLTTTQVFGVGWAVFVTDRDTGASRLVGFDCEYPGEDPPVPPPLAPSPGAIVEQSRDLLGLEIGLSPSVERRGVSQLETWLWCEGPQSVTLDPELDGYSISAEVVVASVLWRIDGPDGVVELGSDSCGRAPLVGSDGGSAAAGWTPNEPGVSSITQSVSWAGSWSLRYEDPAVGLIDLGTFPFPAVTVVADPVLYEVYEIQTVGIAPPPLIDAVAAP
jgi:hypothetical protein